ncbi:MAG: type II toxin-antitoxin system VapC family toxin [Chloroflexota bacterium]|nr:MAG: type II toxin-antitoxin system VapC family toxin [Chloroflexota bacterium]
MKYMLDTNICIELIRRQPTNLVKQLTSLRVGDIGISAITVAELQHGVSKSRNPEQNLAALEQFLLPLAIADFGYDAAVAYGQLRAHLERKGALIGSMDLLIAAHALSLEVTLVTNNIKEFTRVPQLNVEDWTKA